MLKYINLRKSLYSKSKRSTSPPRSIPHDRDTDKFNPAQLDSVQKLVNDSITTMSDNLMAKFSSMFDQCQSRQHNISCTSSSAVPGQSATRTEPASRLPTDRITCPAGRRFRKGHEDTVPHEDISVCDRIMDETPETPRHPPGDTGEPQDLRRAPAFVKHHQTGTGFDSQPDEDNNDDDRVSEAEGAQSVKNYVRLMHSIHNRFPYSVPASAPREHPRCELRNFFSPSEVTSSAKPIVTLYPRVDEILDSYADRATRFAKESKPLHRVLPFKRKATPVSDRPDFCLGTDALLQNWNGWQTYSFLPWSLILAVLQKLRSSSGVILTIVAPYWSQRPGFPDLLDLVVDSRSLFHGPETFCVSPTSTVFIWECPGCVFMLGDYQAIHRRRWILQACSSAGVLSTLTIFACGLPV